MIDGEFIAHEFRLEGGGKSLSGMCADVTKDTKFKELGDSKEDKMTAFFIAMMCSCGHKFEGGELGKDYMKYSVTFDRGKSWQRQPDKFRMEGNRVILVSRFSGDRLEKDTGIMTLDGDLLTVSKTAADGESFITFKKV